jgi:hypothetical protein
MTRARAHAVLIALALSLGVASAAVAARVKPRPVATHEQAVPAVDSFELAAILAKGSPDDIVIAMDAPKHPLRGATPIAVFGADDAAFAQRAPKARRVILAGADEVRMDRIARSLLSTGRRVAVLRGGTAAWDAAMDADPKAPDAHAPGAVWARYRNEVALRRSFGDASAAPAAPVAAPVAPIVLPQGHASKKREGC